MVYLTHFYFPTMSAEEDYLQKLYKKYELPSVIYPFKIFPEIELKAIDFTPITILYGGNGSGKSTIINVIAQKIKAKRLSPYNTARLMDDYIKLCKFDTDLYWCGEEFDITGVRSDSFDIADITTVVTSDDIFRSLMEDRVKRKQREMKSDMLQRQAGKYSTEPLNSFDFGRRIDFEDGGYSVNRYMEAMDLRKKGVENYLNKIMGEGAPGMSNGENSFVQLSTIMEKEGLYFLDEPENSLSPIMQEKLAMLIAYMAKYNNSQIVIATHSPFLLGIEGATIYNLDAAPAAVNNFEQLEAMRHYYEFFKEKAELFEKR